MENLDIASIILIIALLAYEARRFFKQGKTEQINQLKDSVLKLFLLAEKQGLTGPEKMKWVSSELYKFLPSDIIKKIISEESIEIWLQKVYNEARHELVSELEQKK